MGCSGLGEKVGSFVVGIPTKALEEYRKEHPTEGQLQLFAVYYPIGKYSE